MGALFLSPTGYARHPCIDVAADARQPQRGFRGEQILSEHLCESAGLN